MKQRNHSLERYLTECNPRTRHSDVTNDHQTPISPTEDPHRRRQHSLKAKNKTLSVENNLQVNSNKAKMA